MDRLISEINSFIIDETNPLKTIIQITEICELIDRISIQTQWDSVPEFRISIYDFIYTNYLYMIDDEQLEQFFKEVQDISPKSTSIRLIELIYNAYDKVYGDEKQVNIVSRYITSFITKTFS